MKITLTKKEAKALMDSLKRIDVKENPVICFKKALEDCKYIHIKKLENKDVNIFINDDCISDFLELFGKYTNLFISQAKTLYETMELFTNQYISIAEKYNK